MYAWACTDPVLARAAKYNPTGSAHKLLRREAGFG